MKRKTGSNHNSLANVAFRLPSMSAKNGRFVASLVSRLDSRNNKSFRSITVTPEEYKAATKCTSCDVQMIERELGDLVRLTCVIKQNEQSHFLHLIDYASFNHESGVIHLRINEEIKPYLLGLHKKYTMGELECFMQLKSKHSQRVFELLIQNKDAKENRYFELDELKEKLGLFTTNKQGLKTYKYPAWRDFERRVLVPAEAELFEVGLVMIYDSVKRGRNIKGVSIYLDPYDPHKNHPFFAVSKNGKTDFGLGL